MAAQSTTIVIAKDTRAHPDPTTGERGPQTTSATPPYGWTVWYGLITRRWWALPPAWYPHVPDLLEAGDQDTLAALIQRAERARPRFDRTLAGETGRRRHMATVPSRVSASMAPAAGRRSS